jgi:hypothetical protein
VRNHQLLKSLRKCQDKWNNVYNDQRLCPELELISIGWISMIEINKLNGNVYSESRLNTMHISNER